MYGSVENCMLTDSCSYQLTAYLISFIFTGEIDVIYGDMAQVTELNSYVSYL